MKGYVGEACPECGNFTMVRNGTCLKCDNCGNTTGAVEGQRVETRKEYLELNLAERINSSRLLNLHSVM